MLKNKKSAHFLCVALIIMGGFFICQNKSLAANQGDIIINELMWMGSSASSSDEWIELRNMTDDEIEISNWQITKRTSSGNEILMLTIPANTKIPKNGLFLISNNSEKSDLAINPNLTTNLTLADLNLAIKLYGGTWNLDKEPIDIAGDGGKPLAGSYIKDQTWQSMERNDIPGDGADKDNWHTATSSINFKTTIPLGTPGEPNSQIQPPQNPTYPDQIFINEILPNPADSEDNEFIELYNNNSFDVDLVNWQVGDNTTSRYTIKLSDFSSTIIPAKSYFILPRTITKIALNNEGDSVKLYQPDQNLVDQINYEKSFEGQSYNKINNTWQWSKTLTPNSLNIISQNNNEVSEPKSKETIQEIPPGPYSKKIIITEILPNPNGSDTDPKGEFIEIKNISKKTIDLYAWSIDDQDGGSKPCQIKTHLKIKPKKYYVFYRAETKLSLNNSNESARILWPDKKVSQEIKFTESAKEGQSYALKNKKWSWTTILTPGKKNQISQELKSNETKEPDSNETLKQENSQTKILSIKEVRGLQRYDSLKTAGIVTILPKTISELYFYIQDETAGIQIYFSKKDFPDLKIGDKIEVAGKLSEASGEKRILISSKENIKILASNQNLDSQTIKTGQASEDFEGKLVLVSGQVEKTAGSTIYLNDGSGTLKVYIPSSSNIEKPKFSKGEWYSFAGVISETSSGYRLLPRSTEDIKLGKNSFDPSVGLTQIPKAGTSSKIFLILSLLIISIYLIKTNAQNTRAKIKKTS